MTRSRMRLVRLLRKLSIIQPIFGLWLCATSPSNLREVRERQGTDVVQEAEGISKVKVTSDKLLFTHSPAGAHQRGAGSSAPGCTNNGQAAMRLFNERTGIRVYSAADHFEAYALDLERKISKRSSSAPDPRLKRLPSTRRSSKRDGTFFKLLCPPSCCRDAVYTRGAHNHRLSSIIWHKRGSGSGFDAAGAERLRWIAELTICNGESRLHLRDDPGSRAEAEGAFASRAMDETNIATRFGRTHPKRELRGRGRGGVNEIRRGERGRAGWCWICRMQRMAESTQRGYIRRGTGEYNAQGAGGRTGARGKQGQGEGRKERIHEWGRTRTERERETTRAGSAGLRVGLRVGWHARRRRRGGNTHARKHERSTAERGHGSELGTAAREEGRWTRGKEKTKELTPAGCGEPTRPKSERGHLVTGGRWTGAGEDGSIRAVMGDEPRVFTLSASSSFLLDVDDNASHGASTPLKEYFWRGEKQNSSMEADDTGGFIQRGGEASCTEAGGTGDGAGGAVDAGIGRGGGGWGPELWRHKD
ncbi:hypothetical protein DFH09DRAFT_1422771 [Mycena vulgaris]|nr:hypothetical protein DFH09DRAFT_1422771 [Mycena vulgaris]